MTLDETLHAHAQWDGAREAWRSGKIGAGELACVFVASRVRRAAGARWLQGEWRPPIACAVGSPGARLVARQRLRKIERCVAEGLVAWANGARDVDLLFHVPSPSHVLSLQARGRRCVSLLSDDTPTGSHEDALAFAVHDLCHLEKLVDPEHHVAQVGFFAMVDAAMADRRWPAFEARFDDAWACDRDYVVADMNGSPIFLFAALKMKLKMAVRRRVARERGGPGGASGPLDATELGAFRGALAELFDLLDLTGEARDAAEAVSTRRDAPAPAVTLFRHLEARGRAALTCAGS